MRGAGAYGNRAPAPMYRWLALGPILPSTELAVAVYERSALSMLSILGRLSELYGVGLGTPTRDLCQLTWSAYLTCLVGILVGIGHHSRKVEFEISVALCIMRRRLTETAQDAAGNNKSSTMRSGGFSSQNDPPPNAGTITLYPRTPHSQNTKS